MSVVEIFNKIVEHHEHPACVYKDQSFSYEWLHNRVQDYLQRFSEKGIKQGSVVSLIADYSPEALAIFIALIHVSAIIMPLTNVPIAKQKEYEDMVNPECIIQVDAEQNILFHPTGKCCSHPIINQLRALNHPGLIILSSGSTGKSKAIVHDFSLLIQAITPSKKRLNIISFLLFDHIGGINTILNAMYSGNCLVVPEKRTPESIGLCIHKHQVQVLITSPSFLNLMSIQGVFNRYDFDCLKQINYGSEIMPESLLQRLIKLLPETRFNQAYGLSELGVIKTRTTNQQSSFISIDDKNIEYRISNGCLEIKSKSSMLGYLNATNPFTEDGWFMTGDMVEILGEEIRILGRNSELINVGGEKVFPAEIENILLQLPEIEDVVVYGEPNYILGNIVVAKIKLKPDIEQSLITGNARKFCSNRLPAFKIPQKFIFVTDISYGERFKKMRNKGVVHE